MPDIAPVFRPGGAVLIARPTAGVPTAHFDAPASGTLCGLPASACSGGARFADLLLLTMALDHVEVCPVCREIVQRQCARTDVDPVDPGAA